MAETRRELTVLLITLGAGIITSFLVRQWWGWLVGAALVVGGLVYGVIAPAVTKHGERRRTARTPRRIQPSGIPSAEAVGTPTVIQGPRPGWEGKCQYMSAAYDFGRGVRLTVRNDRAESFPAFRCMVRGPDNYRASGTSRLFDTDQSRDEESRHFPGEFTPEPPSDPPPPGTYEVEWFADTGDPADDKELFLARASFQVTERGEYFCLQDSSPEA